MWFACCSSKEDLQSEKAAEKEQDDVKATIDFTVKQRPALRKVSKDAGGGPGSVAAPRAALKNDDAKAKAKALAEKIATQLKEGEIAFGGNDWDAAVSIYSKVIELDLGACRAWAGRGGAYLRQGLLEEALADLNEALTIDGSNLFALRDRGEVRFKTGDFDGASADFNKKLSLAPGDGRALCGRGEVKMQKGDKEGALADFQFAMRLKYPGAEQLYKTARDEE